MWQRWHPSFRMIFQIMGGLGTFFVLIYLLDYFERDSNQSSIIGPSNAIWYAIVTLTGVGYGDIYPVTIYGRVVGYVFLLLSLGAYSLLIGKVASFMSTLKERKRLGYGGTDFRDHSIIIGWNETARHVGHQLVGVGKRIAIITEEVGHAEIIQEHFRHYEGAVFVLHADFGSYDSLKKVNITEAKVVFLNLEKDMDKLVYVLHAKKIYPDQNYVAILENSDLRNAFLTAGVSYAVAKNEIASKLLASYIFEPDVAMYSEDILSYAEHDMDYDIKQYRVTEQNPYKDREYHFAFFDMKKRFNVVLIGISKKEAGEQRTLIKNPSGSVRIDVGDYLIIILNGKATATIDKVFGIAEGI